MEPIALVSIQHPPGAIKILQVTSYIQNPNPAQSHVEFSSSVLGLDSKYEISGWVSRRSTYKEPGRYQIMSIFSSDVARDFSASFFSFCYFRSDGMNVISFLLHDLLKDADDNYEQSRSLWSNLMPFCASMDLGLHLIAKARGHQDPSGHEERAVPQLSTESRSVFIESIRSGLRATIKILQVTRNVRYSNSTQSHVVFSSRVLGQGCKYEISG
ncbi:hypothetical protein AVEN_203194-1 [Araneus ventricosus]|uniref:Uncharacterized protein n=1 Tax=Araneus ventricosus TaxID=182803 RepID=A0A4Y2CIP9_ARAVE|nr:hypothetical protein AVEN_203194-1 [Araneus ventricosus]